MLLKARNEYDYTPDIRMILFDLRCAEDHEYEAWFRDSASFEAQSAAGEIICPVCGDADVVKAPMAPRLAKRKSGDASPAGNGMAMRVLEEMHRHVRENCDDVGDKFAEEARKIHYGEAEKRGIYGEATNAEARELTEEGVDIHRLPQLPRQDA